MFFWAQAFQGPGPGSRVQVLEEASFLIFPVFRKATFPRCSSKWLFLKICQYSQETPMLEPLFNKAADLKT